MVVKAKPIDHSMYPNTLNRTPTTKALTIPPINPSTVLFGLISGHNFRFPIALPMKYAPESVPNDK